jgi:hypothetical protein
MKSATKITGVGSERRLVLALVTVVRVSEL